MCYPVEFGHSRSNGTSVIKEICLAFRLSGSLEVIGTDTDRSATSNFLLKCQDYAFAPRLLYHQPAFDDNKSHQLRRSSVPSFENCRVIANKFHVSSRLSRGRNSNINSCCHLAEAKTSFLPCKEEDRQTSLSRQSQAITHASTTGCPCLSHPVVFKCLHPRPSTP